MSKRTLLKNGEEIIMKHTYKILAALLVVIALLMSLATVIVSAEEATGGEESSQVTDGGEASTDAPEAEGSSLVIDNNTVAIAICIAIAVIGMLFAAICMIRKPKLVWWKI